MKIYAIRFLNTLISWKDAHLSPRQFVYILSFVVGLLSGMAAIILKNTVHIVQHFLTQSRAIDEINFIYLFFPLTGIILTVLYVRFFVKDNISHGITRILYAISRKEANLKPHNNYTSLVGSTLTVGFGGSVGLEAPIVLTGSSLGSTLGRLFKLNYKTKTLLLGCGAAGAIAGIFKAPIAAVIFALEVLMLDLTMWSIVPLLISAVTASSLAYFFMGRAEIFRFEMIYYFDLRNIPYYIILGIFTGLISWYFTRSTIWAEKQFGRIGNPYLKWIIGGSVLGLIILFIPPLYGEGYETLNALLNGNPVDITYGSLFFKYSNQFWMMAIFLALILFFKVIAMAVTTESGGVGGIFAPSLFMGGISGYLVARLLNYTSFIHVPERNFALVGMAGMMSGVMHAPLTAIFLIAEITGGYGLFIPIMITSTVSYITIMYFEPHSIYHKRLAKRNELITHDKDHSVLTLIDMKRVIETDFLVVHPDDKLIALIDAIARSNRNIFPVVKNGILRGIVLLDDIRHIMFNTELYSEIAIRDLMYLPPTYIEPDEPMDEVMQKFEDTQSWNLPVLRKGEYIGFISKSKLLTVYRNRLIEISADH